MRAGDLVLVCQLSQLDRSGCDDRLIALLHELSERGIGLRSLAEPAIDTTGPSGRAFFDIIPVFAQLCVEAIQVHRRYARRAATIDTIATTRRRHRDRATRAPGQPGWTADVGAR
ncbi:hypothetical protein E3O42_06035 [Cryobacterium adonitolivorans]|uniref:Resolvase/invertase-type recombinase catalytic domain-containing protein n=1 Tax=Cryobacterium adonitolivorans TaxID=1259189 RepID=A0A4V6QGS5_9MICO|nr:hypothetical protein E3O42_06035 [Cryobacterium adonitolivorans]